MSFLKEHPNTKLSPLQIFLTKCRIKLLNQCCSDTQQQPKEFDPFLCFKLKRKTIYQVCFSGEFSFVLHILFRDLRDSVDRSSKKYSYNVVIVLFSVGRHYNDIEPMIYQQHCIDIEKKFESKQKKFVSNEHPSIQ